MKILMILEGDFPPDERVEKEALTLIAARHEIYVAAYTFKRINGIKLEQYRGINIFKKHISLFIYKSSVGALNFPFYFNYWRKYLNQISRQINPDVMHVHDLPLAKIGYELKQKYNAGFVLDLHENFPALLKVSKHTNTLFGKLLSSNRQWRRYEKKFVFKADEVIVVIDEAKSRISGYRINKSQPIVVMNTLDERIIPAIRNKKVNSNVLFYSGGITSHRGLDIVIRALPAVVKEIDGFEFWIVGKGNEMEKLIKLTKNLELEKNVVFHDWKSFSDMFDLMSLAYVTIIPHLKNAHTDTTIPNKLFQYMYLNKPVISSDCVPIKRILEETGCGLVYTFNNPDELAKKIVWVFKDHDEYRKLAENGKNFITGKYNWENEGGKIIGLYAKLSG